MKDAKYFDKVNTWMIQNPDKFVDGIFVLARLGFDFNRNTAGDLIDCVIEISEIDDRWERTLP